MNANTHIGSLILAGLTALYAGCIDPPQSCDDRCSDPEPIPEDASLVIRVTDSAGEPFAAGSVVYSVYTEDGGDPIEGMTDLLADCVEDPCTTWIAGRDVAGHFWVSASYEDAARGCAVAIDDEVTVELAQGGHPATQEVTLPVTEGECRGAEL